MNESVVLTSRPRTKASVLLGLALTVLAPACSDSSGPGGPSHLEFTVQPSSTVDGSPIAPAIAVAARDNQGNTLPGWDQPISISLEGGPAGTTLTGPVTADPVAGIVLFEGVEVEATGVGFRLTASSGNLEEGLSEPFTVHEPFQATEVFAGLSHTCTLQGDGTAHCWGDNSRGLLGNGDELDRWTPTPVATTVRFASLSVNARHNCGLTVEGLVYCWGQNEYGQLGNGTLDDAWLPTPVPLSGPAVSVAAGGYHSCALLTTGDAYCWGANWDGDLGVESKEDEVTLPSKVVGGHTWASIDAGHQQVCGLDTEGLAFCWGPNFYGENGNGTLSGGGNQEPHPVSGDHRFSKLIAGGAHCHGQTCGITDVGTVLCWGKNYQDGHEPNTERSVNIPQPLVGDPGFVEFFVGPIFLCGLTSDQGLYCFGDLNATVVGPEHQYIQTPLRLFPDAVVTGVALGREHLCVTEQDGRVLCVGFNRDGRLGSPGVGFGTTIPTAVWKPSAGG